MDEYLWPARHVAEYAYCPRLFYLMEVEGVYYPSADTEKGKAVHKRVDKPSAANSSANYGNGHAAGAAAEESPSDALPPDPDKPKSVRSLALTSRKLGLTATLDLAEITGNVAVPVEYRKGRPQYATIPAPPDDPGESEPDAAPPPASPWPTDRVRMQSELETELNMKADQCIIIDLGGNEESAREAVEVLGESLPKAESGMVVV